MDQMAYLAEFEAITKEMLETTRRKNSDYASAEDAFKNFRLTEQLGLTSIEVGILVRISDKLTRISNLVDGSQPHVKDEAIEDTVQDMAVYSIILLIALRNRRRMRETKVFTTSSYNGDLPELINN
jgi:hypothetical protein